MRFPSRRWRLGLLAALLLVGAIALGCALALWPEPGATEANFEKLQIGVTPEQEGGEGGGGKGGGKGGHSSLLVQFLAG